MNRDQMREAELVREAVRAAERLRGERGQVVDVLGLAGAEQRLQERIAQDARIEGVLEAVQRLLAAGVLEERGMPPNATGGRVLALRALRWEGWRN
jgi:hypothetical protein